MPVDSTKNPKGTWWKWQTIKEAPDALKVEKKHLFERNSVM